MWENIMWKHCLRYKGYLINPPSFSSYRTCKTQVKQSSLWRFKFFPICANTGTSGCRDLPENVRIQIRTHVDKATCISEEVSTADGKILDSFSKKFDLKGDNLNEVRNHPQRATSGINCLVNVQSRSVSCIMLWAHFKLSDLYSNTDDIDLSTFLYIFHSLSNQTQKQNKIKDA